MRHGTLTITIRFSPLRSSSWRQSLSNPYTGVLAIFASRLLNDRPPLIHEDSPPGRDFVYVKDLFPWTAWGATPSAFSGSVFSFLFAVVRTTISNRFSNCQIASENEIHQMTRMRFTHVNRCCQLQWFQK
jgi:dTDP-L-rhamnose 4-epimerase